LIAAILDRAGILSKLTVKILHRDPNFPLSDLLKLCQLFGNDYNQYLGNVSTLYFERNAHYFKTSETGSSFKHLLIEKRANSIQYFDINSQEKENIVHIINDMSSNTTQIRRDIVEEFYDHFRMIYKLREFYPGMRLNVRKFNTFVSEHSRLSAMERAIKKGYSIHKIFDSFIIEEIEKVIEVIELDEPPLMWLPDLNDQKEYEKKYNNYPKSAICRVFKPVLLRTSEGYSDEGEYMHHCVSGYIDTDRSIIVSLRINDERVTCEYNISDRKCIQARYIKNGNPPDYFKRPLEILNDRIKRIPLSIGPIEKRLIPLKINGITVAPQINEPEDRWLDNINLHRIIQDNLPAGA
jgi:hypothetical protein